MKGVFIFFSPALPPKITGSSTKIQGASTVSTPARNERTSCVMMLFFREQVDKFLNRRKISHSSYFLSCLVKHYYNRLHSNTVLLLKLCFCVKIYSQYRKIDWKRGKILLNNFFLISATRTPICMKEECERLFSKKLIIAIARVIAVLSVF